MPNECADDPLISETHHLPDLQIAAVQAVVQFAAAGRGDPHRDDDLYEAVREIFPLIIASRASTRDQPPQNPHIVVGSDTAQLGIGAVQADLLFQFPGDADSMEPALAAVSRALTVAIEGLRVGGYNLTNLGVVATAQLSTFDVPDLNAAEFIFRHHVRADTDPGRLQDALARIGLRIADRYFVNLQIQNYETRQIAGPVMFGFPRLVSPWDGTVTDEGIQLIADVNTFLQARLGEIGELTDEDVSDVTRLLHTVLMDLAPGFVHTGAVPGDALDAVVSR